MSYKIIDTHAHYTSHKYSFDRDGFIQAEHRRGVDKIVEVGTNTDYIQKAMRLAKQYPFVYCGVGYFPHDVMELERDPKLMKNLSKLLADNCVVYLGEIGLDYHRKTGGVPKDIQEKWFRKQIELAIEKNIPICIHSRDAEDDTMRIIKDYPEVSGSIHCFSYGPKSAEFYLKRGFYLGVGGTITYPSNILTREAISNTPINRILTETDAPYLSPFPVMRERNASTNIRYVVEEIAKLKNLDVSMDALGKKLYQNAVDFLKF